MTAYVTGTASDYADLYTKLVAFLTTDSTLVAAGQNWTQVWTGADATPNDIILRGPGLSASESIYVGLRPVVDVDNSLYQVWFCGMTAVSGSGAAASLIDHVNVSPFSGIYLDSAPMGYWFIANGRRFVVIVQVGGTVFESAYCGYFLPYAAPSQYPAPMFIGGMFGSKIYGDKSFRSVEPGHTAFFNPSLNAGVYPYNSSAQLLDPSGVWYSGLSMTTGSNPASTSSFMVGPRNMGTGNLAIVTGDTFMPGYATLKHRHRDLYGGGYALTPLTLTQQIPGDQTFGILDGVYDITGFNNAAGNLVSIGGVNHMVVQNAFRTEYSDFCAVKLG